jgi:gliding motility-associated-like protein
MNFVAPPDIYFEATSAGQTITTAGKSFNRINFFGIGGEWTLQDNIITSELVFRNGILNTNNKNVSIGPINGFESFFGSPYQRTLNMGSSVFNVTSWNADTSITINSGTSTINISEGGLGGGGKNYYDVFFTNPNNTTSNPSLIGDNNTFRNCSFAGHGYIINHNTFNKLTFFKNGVLYDDNTFNDLVFSPGYTYTLKEGKTQTINNTWKIQGSCTNYITLISDAQGQPAYVVKPTDSVIAFNIHAKDIHCSGGSQFIAYTSVDLGGNSGWNFSVLPPLFNPGAIVGDTVVCPGQTNVLYSIAPVPGAISYQWTVPPGAIIVSGQGTTTITLDFTNGISGNITVLASNGCNVSNDSSQLAVSVFMANPFTTSLGVNPSGTVCPGTPLTFTALANLNGGNSVLYNFRRNGVIIQSSSSHVFVSNSLTNGDSINCEVIVNNNCFIPVISISNTITTSIALTQMASITISTPASSVCPGNPVAFTAIVTNAGNNPIYSWKRNGVVVGQNSAAYIDYNPVNNEAITCTLIPNSACVSNAQAVSNLITILFKQPPPPVEFGPSVISICEGDTKILTAPPGYQTYRWQDQSAGSSFMAVHEGRYFLVAIDSCGRISTDTITVSFYPKQKSILPKDTAICSFEKIAIRSLIPSARYLWSTNAVTSFITVTAPGTYWLEIIDNNKCLSRDSILINSRSCVKGLFVPTAFTPNSDQHNDFLRATVHGVLLSFNFSIFNRYGQRVYNSLSPDIGWNGTFNGIQQNPGSYVWLCFYQLEGEASRYEKGTFTLIR